MQVYQLRSGSGGGAVADLLDELEAEAAALGVSHFAVSGPTLEEVFLAAAAADDAGDGGAAAAGSYGGAHANAGGDGPAGRAASHSSDMANGASARAAQSQAAGKRAHGEVPTANGKDSGGQVAYGAPAGGMGSGVTAAPAANGLRLGSHSPARADGAVELQALGQDPSPEAALAAGAPALGPLSPAEPRVGHAEGSASPPAPLPEAHAPVPSASRAGGERTAAADGCGDGAAGAASDLVPDDSRAGGAAGREADASEQAGSAGVDGTGAAGTPPNGWGGSSGRDVAFDHSSEHDGEVFPNGDPEPKGLSQGSSGRKVAEASSRAGDLNLAGPGGAAADADAEWTAVSLDEPSRRDPAMQQGRGSAEGPQGGSGNSGVFGRVLRRRHRRRLRWWVAFREMVRKRAIGAGAPRTFLNRLIAHHFTAQHTPRH